MRADLLSIALAICFVGGGTAHGEASCQMQELGELPVTTDGNVLVDTQVNGRPVKMIVDTGSAATFLMRPAAERLGLALRRLNNLEMYGVGGKDQGASARVKEFKVANLVGQDFDILVAGRHDMGVAEGVLGALFLMQTDVEFDFPHKTLRFFKPRNCKGDQVVYWGTAYSVAPMVGSTEGRIEVSVLLNGKTTPAQMDTGATASVVTTQGAANAGLNPTSGDVSAHGPIHGLGAELVQSHVGVFPTFSFGDETIHNARLEIADLYQADKEVQLDSHIPTKVVDEANMLIGADFFRSHRVYVSLSQRKVYVSYVGGPVFSAPASSAPR